MKVIILAGGYGTRLGSITDEIPKPMVLIGDKPIIAHIMNIYAEYGYTDFIIALGYKQHIIKEHFEKNDYGWNVALVDTGLNTLKGGRLKRLEKYLEDGDTHMMTYGDGVANIDIDKLVDFHHSQGKMLTISGVHPPARFGELIEKDGKLLSFKEKPQMSTGIISGGFFVFNKKLLEHLTEDENCDLEYGVFEKLAEQGEIMVYKHENKWECVDTERDLKHLNKMWAEGKAFWKDIK